MTRPNTPPNWEAPFEAYEAKYLDEAKHLACAYVGVQDRGGNGEAALSAAKALLGNADGPGPDGPGVVEQGWSDDVPGAHMRILMAYWRDADAFARWRSAGAVDAWLNDSSDTLIGKWIESAEIRPRALDTLIAVKDVNWGFGKLADSVEVTPYHAYWGGTRDRIQITPDDPLLNPDGPDLPQVSKMPKGIGQTIDVVMPGNAVFSRGGPDWSQCPPDEMEQMRNSVYPAYVAGGRYLRDYGRESGCYSCYFIQQTDEDGQDVQRNHQIGYFVQLSDLERWTKDHPTHKAIYGRFMTMMTKLPRPPQMNLYHEVSPIPPGGLKATYVNCLPETGLLRFGTVRDGA